MLTSALACVQDTQGAYLRELARPAAQQPPTAQGNKFSFLGHDISQELLGPGPGAV